MRKFAMGGARFQWASDQSLIVYFGGEEKKRTEKAGRASNRVRINSARPLQKQDTVAAHESVRRFVRLLEKQPITGVRNLHPGYASVLVKFDGLALGHAELEKTLRKYLERMEDVKLPEARVVEIPVCYGGEYGSDLEDVAAAHGISAERVIELHEARSYSVYFLGFVPGFAYLGELAEEISMPRLAMPRRSVPAGSVGIAGNQTGVYPFATPGGWRLLGRTPIKMFQVERPGLSLLAIGDRVRFVQISREKFAELERS
jgi:inhibitor of KinA